MILEALNDGSIFTENVSWTADGSLSEFVSCVDEDRMPEPFYPSEFKVWQSEKYCIEYLLIEINMIFSCCTLM